MSKDMLGIIVRKLVTMSEGTLGSVYDLLEKLSSDPEWVTAFKKFLRKEDPWQTATTDKSVALADPPVQQAPALKSPAPTPRPWRVGEDDVIYFTLTSDGTTGEAWIARHERRGKSVGMYAKSVLRSRDFVPSPAGTEYKVAVLKGSLFSDDKRTTANIRAEATRRGLSKPHAEVACLIRDAFTDDDIKAMRLWKIVAMHDPIKDSDGGPRFLGADRDVSGYSLSAFYADPDFRWHGGRGFAFVE